MSELYQKKYLLKKDSSLSFHIKTSGFQIGKTHAQERIMGIVFRNSHELENN